jgi:prepilin-type N-terminal cleavage/methylation domain-containing protein
MRKNQHGVTLIEMIMVMALVAVATMLSFYEKQADLESARARQVGGLLYQYNNAVRARIAKGDITTPQNNIGSAWLKNSSCGGPFAVGKEYLPCDFPAADITDPISFGRLTLASAVTVTGTPPTRKVQATTTSTPFILYSQGKPTVRADLSGLASLSAAAALMSGYQSGSSGNSPLTATTDSSYKSDPITAKMTMIASNTADSDVWLRTDGGNSMHATLNFDSTDPSNRMIMGASRVQNLAGQVLHLGSGSALTPVTTSSVVVDSDAEIMGSFRIRNILTVDGSATVNGDIRSNGNIYAAGYVQAAANVLAENNLIAHGNVISSGSVDAGTNVTAGGAVSAGGNVNAGGAFVGQIFYDSNNMGYYVDPHSTTNLNSMAANYISSNGRVRAAEFVEIGGIATVGWGCAPSGLMGRDATGAILSCQSGIWRGAGAINVSAPVVLAASGFVANFGQCFTSPKNALISASGPGDSQLVINGVVAGVSGAWAGKYSDVALDSVITGVVGAGQVFCYYAVASTGMGRSNGIRVVATYLD